QERQQTALELKREFERLELGSISSKYQDLVATQITADEDPDRTLRTPIGSVRTEKAARVRIANQVKECPKCKRCFDEKEQRCPDDALPLLSLEAAPRVINNRFRLDRLLGRGGMGAVYQAIDLALEREVACKVVRASVMREEGAFERFRQEA